MMDVLLCAREESTGFHKKECSYSNCKECGWANIMRDLKVVDSVVSSSGGAKELVVNFRVYENVSEEVDRVVHDDESFGVESAKSSRPMLTNMWNTYC